MAENIRIVGISSSPRHGNTELLVKEALQAAKDSYPQVTTEFYNFKGKTIKHCLDCKGCERRRTMSLTTQCLLKDDWVEMVKPLVDPVPNGVILGSPVYFSDVNSEMRAFMERFTSLLKPYWFPDIELMPPDYSRTAGGAVSVGFHRHGGQETAISTILRFMVVVGMAVVGSYCPEQGPIGYLGGAAWEDATGTSGRKGVLADKWGLYSARVVGRKVAHTAILLANSPEITKMAEPLVDHLINSKDGKH